MYFYYVNMVTIPTAIYHTFISTYISFVYRKIVSDFKTDFITLRRQNMVAHYIPTQHIMDLCKEVVQSPGAWVTKMWWYQEGLDLKGARAVVVAADE